MVEPPSAMYVQWAGSVSDTRVLASDGGVGTGATPRDWACDSSGLRTSDMAWKEMWTLRGGKSCRGERVKRKESWDFPVRLLQTEVFPSFQPSLAADLCGERQTENSDDTS